LAGAAQDGFGGFVFAESGAGYGFEASEFDLLIEVGSMGSDIDGGIEGFLREAAGEVDGAEPETGAEVIGFELDGARELEGGLAEEALLGHELADAEAEAWFVDGAIGGEESVPGAEFWAELFFGLFAELDAFGGALLDGLVVLEVDLGDEVIGVEAQGGGEAASGFFEAAGALEFDAPIDECAGVPGADEARVSDALIDERSEALEDGVDGLPEGEVRLDESGGEGWREDLVSEVGVEAIGEALRLEVEGFEVVTEAWVEVMGGLGGGDLADEVEEIDGAEPGDGGIGVWELGPLIGETLAEGVVVGRVREETGIDEEVGLVWIILAQPRLEEEVLERVIGEDHGVGGGKRDGGEVRVIAEE
jgi:hypothetical protein